MSFNIRSERAIILGSSRHLEQSYSPACFCDRLVLSYCRKYKEIIRKDVLIASHNYTSISVGEVVLGIINVSLNIQGLEIGSYWDRLELFEDLNYMPETMQDGIRGAQRICLPVIGDKWGATTSKEITVENMKQLLFLGNIPLI